MRTEIPLSGGGLAAGCCALEAFINSLHVKKQSQCERLRGQRRIQSGASDKKPGKGTLASVTDLAHSESLARPECAPRKGRVNSPCIYG